MNPEEKVLLERTLKLSEENNRLLHRLDRARRLGLVWGFIKILILIVPLVAGYIFLEPYFDDIGSSYTSYKELLNAF